MKIYIASPFFDEKSREWVTAKEADFSGIKVPYFSPRQDGLNFNELKGHLREDRIEVIFNNNVRQLRESDNIVVNLTPCNGRLDIGTLWELGAWIGYKGTAYDDGLFTKFTIQPELKYQILDFCEELASTTVHTDLDSVTILHDHVADRSPISSLCQMTDLGAVVSVDQVIPTHVSETNTFICTDDFDWRIVMFMGYLYAKNIPYTTYSLKGYGSNVMIAASSKGHISFPGKVSGTSNSSIE